MPGPWAMSSGVLSDALVYPNALTDYMDRH